MYKTQTLKNSLLSAVLFCSIILIGSCKKGNDVSNQSTAEQIQNAKQWYSIYQQSNQLALNSSVNGARPFRFELQWEQSTALTIEGSQAVVVPVKTNLIQFAGAKTQFNIVLKLNGEVYDLKTVSILNYKTNKEDVAIFNPQELYYAAFTDKDLSVGKELSAQVRVFDNHFKSEKYNIYSGSGRTIVNLTSMSKWLPYAKSNINGKLALNPSDLKLADNSLGCQGGEDIYMVTRVYLNGQLVDIFQEFMYTYCPNNNESLSTEFDNPSTAGGSPGNSNNTVALSFGEPTDKLYHSSGSSEFEEAGVKYRTKYYDWIFHEDYQDLWAARSYEKSTQQRIGVNLWKFTNVTHLSESVEGATILKQISIIKNWVDVTWTDAYASIEINYKVKRSTQVAGTISEYISPDKRSNGTLGVHFGD